LRIRNIKMGEKTILILISLFFGLMPLWMGYLINPRWAAIL
jgi:hypothetical protein